MSDANRKKEFNSWGRVFPAQNILGAPLWLDEIKGLLNSQKNILAVGQGRSYGDVCLNTGGDLISSANLTKLISFDREQGIITAEAGVTLAQLLKIIVPAGWFLPVTPGTQFISLGGAVANDVHGKNHHVVGTFGNSVQQLVVQRSDGRIITCNRQQDSDLFAATIAGLGLTGFIRSVTLKLKKIASHRIVGQSVQFNSLNEFFELTKESDRKYEYTVAWLDCVRSKNGDVRGLFIGGNHEATPPPRPWFPKEAFLSVPLEAPELLLNPWSIKLFNQLWFHKQLSKRKDFVSSFEPFFYPLDMLKRWNLMYGKRGFYQFQCVVPRDNGDQAVSEILKVVGASQAGSFLAVLKEFGSVSSPGMLSFPRPGITLCLDFANRGERTRALLQQLDQLTAQLSGAIYPAKDAVMSQRNFGKYFPQLNNFSSHRDEKFSSSFWKRVTE